MEKIFLLGKKVVDLRLEGGVTYRMAKGTDDISGVYRQYEHSEAFPAGGYQVLARGDSGLCRVALWNDGRFCFSLYDPRGMSRARLEALIGSLRPIH